MLAFTVLGFLAEGERLVDFHLNLFAESPMDATEKAMKQYSNLVVSGVCRLDAGRMLDY